VCVAITISHEAPPTLVCVSWRSARILCPRVLAVRVMTIAENIKVSIDCVGEYTSTDVSILL
jgi:hypothetical protein